MLLAHGGDELRQRLADVGEFVGDRLAVVHEQRQIDRLGGARDAQHFAPSAIFAHDERVGPETFDRLALRVDGADEQGAFARRGLRGGAGISCDRDAGDHGKDERRPDEDAHAKDAAASIGPAVKEGQAAIVAEKR